MMATESNPKSGRYGPVSGLASIDLPREGRRAGGKIEVVHGVAPDPYFAADGEERGRGKAKITRQRQQRVAINAQTDTLEYEARRGRLSVAAYETGRYIDALLERAEGKRSGAGFGEGSHVGVSPLAQQAVMMGKIIAANEKREAAIRHRASRRPRRGAWSLLMVISGSSFRDTAHAESRDALRASAQAKTKSGMAHARSRRISAQSLEEFPKLGSSAAARCENNPRRGLTGDPSLWFKGAISFFAPAIWRLSSPEWATSPDEP